MLHFRTYLFVFLMFSIFQIRLGSEPNRKGVLIEGSSERSGKRIALVVGINEYKDVGLNDLRKARNDAKGIAKILIQNGEFDSVTVMTDEIDPKDDPDSLFPTKLNIDEKLDSILNHAGPNDTFLFFFSGHGISDYEEKSYLLTQDSLLSKPYNSSLSVESIVQRISKKGLKKSLLILDACRDSMFASKNPQVGGMTDMILEGEIFGILYSTKAGFYSYEDDESSYGVFTKYLIYGLEGRADSNRDQKVSFGELEFYITEAVKNWSIRKNKQQKPYTRYFGEKSGDIILSYSTNPDVSLADVPITKQGKEAAWTRSILFPGWGQHYQGDEIKGKTYMGIAAALLLATIDSYSKYREAKNSYNSAIIVPPSSRFGESLIINTLLLEPKKQDLLTAENRLQQVSVLFVAFYLWNLADLALFPAGNSEASKFNFSMYKEFYPMGGTGQANRYEFSYQYRF